MRLFIAVEISEEIKAELVKIVDKFKGIGADVRWVRKEGMHITIKFLGEVDENRKDKIIDIIEKTSNGKRPFTLTFNGLGAFPDLNRPRVIWVGIEKGGEELKYIIRELEELLSDLGFPKEPREFSPHLTLGRVKSGKNRKELAEAVTGYSNFTMPEISVQKINLMESILKREGAEYRKIKGFRLVPEV